MLKNYEYIYNKKGYSINLQLGKQAQEIAFISYIWSVLCKLCKSIALNLSNYEYFKFRWLVNTVVFLENK